jgi:hypothetical protein
MTLSPELLNAIEAGCDGVTPGPWSIRHDTCAECSRRGAAEYDIPELPGGYHAQFSEQADAAHIARLDPATVLDLVAGYRAGMKAHADVIRLRALLARIRSTLENLHV